MVGRSVENANGIRANIKTRALLGRGLTGIHADIRTVITVFHCRVPQFAYGLGQSVLVWSLLQMLLHLVTNMQRGIVMPKGLSVKQGVCMPCFSLLKD